jgi:hypothetical protein
VAGRTRGGQRVQARGAAKRRWRLAFVLATGLVALTFIGRGAADQTVVVSDPFSRTVKNNWGSAPTGGTYSYEGTNGGYSVNGAIGLVSITAANQTKQASLRAVTQVETDESVSFALGKLPAGGALQVMLVARAATDGSGYRAYVRVTPAGSLFVGAARQTAAGLAPLAETATAVASLAPNEQWSLRAHLTGTNPTSVRVKAWRGQEPQAWTLTVADSDPALQDGGYPGLRASTATGVTNATKSTPLNLSFDDFTAKSGVDTTPPTAPTVSGGSLFWQRVDALTLSASGSTDSGGAGFANWYESRTSVDGGSTWSTPTAGSAVLVTSEGETLVQFRSLDRVGNASVWAPVGSTGAGTARIDRSPPSSPSLSGGSLAWRNVSATVTASGSLDSGSGFDHYESRLSRNGGATWSSAVVGSSVVVSAEGETLVQFRAVDVTGNSSGWAPAQPEAASTVRIDRTPPSVPSVSGGSPSWQVLASLTVSAGGASDSGGAGLDHYESRSSRDGGASWSSPQPGSSLAVAVEGETLVQFRALDGAANASAWGPSAPDASGTVRLDRSPPTEPSVSGGSELWQSVDSLTISASGSVDSGSGFAAYESRVSRDGGSSWSSPTVAASTSVAQEGETLVQFRASDAAGNLSAWAPAAAGAANAARIDRTPPSSPAVSGGSLGWQRIASVSVSASGSSDAGGSGVERYEFRSSTDGGSSWSQPTTGASIDVSAEGETLVQFRALDLAGNPSGWAPAPGTAEGTVRIDRSPTPPTVSGGSLGWQNVGSITLSADGSTEFDGTPVARYEFRTSTDGGTSWSSPASGSQLVVSAEGETFAQFRGVSAAGRASSWAPGTPMPGSTARIDRSSPGPPAVSGGSLAWQSVNVVRLTAFSPADAGAPIDHYESRTSIDGGSSWSAASAGDKVDVQGEGETLVQFRAVDGAANLSAWAPAAPAPGNTVRIDRTAPTAPTTAGGSSSWRNVASVTVSAGGASDSGGSGLDYYEYRASSNGGLSWSGATTGSSATISAQGETLLRFRSVDGAGNQSPLVPIAASDTVRIDRSGIVPPTVSGGSFAWQNVDSLTVSASSPSTGIARYEYRTSTDGGASWSAPQTGNKRAIAASGETRVQFRAVSTSGATSSWAPSYPANGVARIDRTLIQDGLSGNGKIAYSGFGGVTDYNIVSVNPDGTGSTAVTSGEYDEWPEWSPDATQIAFARVNHQGAWNIWVINADGSGLRQVTGGTDRYVSSPAWSPDGTRIAYLEAANFDPLDKIGIVNADGTNDHVIATGEFEDQGAISWSVGGEIVVANYDSNALLVMNDDGTNRRTLSPGGSVEEATWSPDGTQIAYEGCPGLRPSETGACDIWVINEDGSGNHDVTNTPAGTGNCLTNNGDLEQFPTWSPDGSQIAFRWLGVRSNGGYCITIGAVYTNGSGLRSIPNTRPDYGEPSWGAGPPPPPPGPPPPPPPPPPPGPPPLSEAARWRPLLRFDRQELFRPLNLSYFFKETGGLATVTHGGSTDDPAHWICSGEAGNPKPEDYCEPLSSQYGIRPFERSHSGNTWYLDISGETVPYGFQTYLPSPSDQCWAQRDHPCRPFSCPRAADAVDCDAPPQSVMYYNRSEHDGLVFWDYWYYFRYNRGPGFLGLPEGSCIPDVDTIFGDFLGWCFDHESDWEGVTVVTSLDPDPVGEYVLYDGHGIPPRRYLWSAMETTPLVPDLFGHAVENGHPQVFVARGTHAAYIWPCVRDCSQPQNKLLGHPLPEGTHDGVVPWTANSDSSCAFSRCVQKMTGLPWVTSASDSDRWGTDCPDPTDRCHRTEAPNAPGNHSRYTAPWVGQPGCWENCDPPCDDWSCEPPAPPGAAAAQPFSDAQLRSRRSGTDDCSSWFGPEVVALVCDPALIRRELARQTFGRPGAVRLSAGPRRGAGAVAGLAQVVGPPLRNGNVIQVSGPVSAHTRLLVRYVVAGRVRTARLTISGRTYRHTFLLAGKGRHLHLRSLSR